MREAALLRAIHAPLQSSGSETAGSGVVPPYLSGMEDVPGLAQVDDQFTAAPQSHLDTDPESTSINIRGDDPSAVVGPGVHSIHAPGDDFGSAPAIGVSMAGGHATQVGAGGKRSDSNGSGKKQQSKKEVRSRSHKSARGEAGRQQSGLGKQTPKHNQKVPKAK